MCVDEASKQSNQATTGQEMNQEKITRNLCLCLIGLGSSGGSLTTETTSPPCSNEPNLLAWWSITTDSAGMTNVLVVTTTVRMLHGIHGNTTHLRPAVPLNAELVISISSFEECSIIGVVTDNNNVITRAPGKDTAVSNLVLDIANDGTFGDRSERQHVADDEVSLLTTVDELAGVHALGGDEKLLLVLEAERVTEGDASERGAATGVVDDLRHHTLEVAIALAEVEGAEAGGALAVTNLYYVAAVAVTTTVLVAQEPLAKEFLPCKAPYEDKAVIEMV
nr:60S ribosomal protein L2 [Ipomoea batatas]